MMNPYLLIVDDDPDILETTRSILEKHGYDVSCAFNGKEAMSCLKNRRPQLILTDVLMPEMDGYLFYKELKNNPLTSKIPVLIVTGRAPMEETFKVIGVDGFIRKPFSPKDLIAEIEHILNLADSKRIQAGDEGQAPKFKVLAVGINKSILDNMVEQGQKAGFIVDAVLSGGQAIATTVKFIPDMIFIDVMLKDMNPVELVEILRKLDQVSQKPIIGYCYYEMAELDETGKRNDLLNVKIIADAMITSGATGYMGRYSHQIFFKTLLESLPKDSAPNG